jgi:hypothetical protein
MANPKSIHFGGSRRARRCTTEHVAIALFAALAALSCDKNSMPSEDAGVSAGTPRPSEPWLDAGSSTGGTSAVGATGTGGSGGTTTGTGGSSVGDGASIDAGSSGGSSGRDGSAGRGGSGANPGAISKPPGANPGHIGRTGSAGSGH